MKLRPSSLYAFALARRSRTVGVLAVGLAAGVALFAVGSGVAAEPPSSAVTVPTTASQAATSEWTGTILPGADAASNCAPLADTPAADTHAVTITVPPGTYNNVDAVFTFSITWADAADDEILTVLDPDGAVVASSDGGSNVETVVANDLAPGTYKAVACAFASTNSVAYSGRLEVRTTTPEVSLPSAPARGLAFSAAVATDPQRDQSEPLIEIDKAGNAYDCGPTGSSNVSDYAQVSPPNQGGDQFHMLGTPPRGQQSGGGGGDCGLAFGTVKNSRGNYNYAYTGLGPLTGFATSTSPNNGKSLATGGPAGNFVTDQGVLADRQWMTFVDMDSVLLIYNQQQPRNVVVQRSDDSGLTYGVAAELAARNPRFPGPIRYIEPRTGLPNGLVYFPWDRGNQINISFSKDRGATWQSCGAAITPGLTTLFATADNDMAGNIYLVYGENAQFHTYLVSTSAAKLTSANAGCIDPAVNAASPPLRPTLFSAPTQVDRDAVRSTVFQWVTAGGAPGRVAVVFAGTETDGNPNSGTFKATWNIYVSQSLNALSTNPADPPTFSQVQATTHPFHYDSICLNGLGCDISVPPGDRSMADFFAVDYNPVNKKIYVTFDRTNKKPDEEVGHVASPMVVTQIAGPSNGGGTLNSNRPVLRASSNDPSGDALSSYSTMAPLVVPADPPTRNEAAADFRSISIGPELDLDTDQQVANGGFTATIRVADLSLPALTAALDGTDSLSLLWVLRFTNGYQDAAAAARWNPVEGFSFGYNDYKTAPTPCAGTGLTPEASEKCLLFPGTTAIDGDVDQLNDTIRFSVPRSLLRALSGPSGHGERPSEVPATVGSRFYDATMFSLANPLSPTQLVQSFLYPLDNTPSMDFLLPRSNPGSGGNTCGPQTDADSDGLIDSRELSLLTLLNIADSDFDGTKDGNDDANRNGEDDEDEDDDDECPDRDDDGDGDDDEDEDDDDDDDD